MRLVYGVSGEGSGHSSRAKEMGVHLMSQGHEVRFVSYDRGFRSLNSLFDCVEIEGLHIISVENKVSMLKTLSHNLGALPALIRSYRKLKRVFRDYQPECVICDFEPMTARLAKSFELPLISLDNQHRMRYMHYEAPKSLKIDQWITERVIAMMVPKPDVSLATTFFFGELKNSKTFLFPPILRSEVGALMPSDKGHHLVYLTGAYQAVIDMLKRFPEERFLVYGYDKDAVDGNVSYRPFSVQGFLEDLASARTVIATAGFTLMSEAMYLQKPYLAFPMQGQFEQELNGLCLEELGFGMSVPRAHESSLSHFFAQQGQYRDALARYEYGISNCPDASKNIAICAKLDELLGNDAALLKQFASHQ
ncbi:MAG: glycosyltransferase family protein [Pseudohongiellaceae bacterium]|nr:glycosyltransferase family protein [Pseudohongiellaceae bacterium]